MTDTKKKSKRENLTTPKGIAQYPRLNKPSDRFDPAGLFSVNLIVPREQAQELMDKLDKMVEEQYQKTVETLTKNGKAGDVKKINKLEPYEFEFDEEGNETGNVIFKFKMKYKVKSKDGKEYKFVPKLFDSKNREVDPNKVLVYGGSTIQVGFSPNPYYMPATRQLGVSLRLKAVRIINLIESSGFDFGEPEEEGYEYVPNDDNNDEDSSSNEDIANEEGNEEEDF